MGMFDRKSQVVESAGWTGMESAVLERQHAPIKSAKLQPMPTEAKQDDYLAEYAELAKIVGIMPPDLGIEAFKAFLLAKDIPVFSLSEVTKYMDEKAAKESKDQAGWEWRPLRDKDNMLNMSFGNGAVRARDQYHSARSGPVETPASDWYSGPQEFDQPEGQIVGSQWVLTGRITKQIGRASQSVYDKTIPLHAVRKIAQIEKEHKGPAYFFVCDYALAPAIEHPDPFLMVCVPNPKLKIGVGRFVIDFWDEPGFGLERMLKPA